MTLGQDLDSVGVVVKDVDVPGVPAGRRWRVDGVGWETCVTFPSACPVGQWSGVSHLCQFIKQLQPGIASTLDSLCNFGAILFSTWCFLG